MVGVHFSERALERRGTKKGIRVNWLSQHCNFLSLFHTRHYAHLSRPLSYCDNVLIRQSLRVLLPFKERCRKMSQLLAASSADTRKTRKNKFSNDRPFLAIYFRVCKNQSIAKRHDTAFDISQWIYMNASTLTPFAAVSFFIASTVQSHVRFLHWHLIIGRRRTVMTMTTSDKCYLPLFNTPLNIFTPLFAL